MAKTIAQIHQQTIDILNRMHSRKCTLPMSLDKVVEIHNRYFDNIAKAFNATGADFFGLSQWTEPVPTIIYAKQWK